jgi:NAD(P)-dependent dehydrogenase (short-subunit alcohol dehydrogenase family)
MASDAGRVQGKVAFVTGGAAGLGRSHTLRLAGEGADVAVFDLGDSHRDAEPGYALSRQSELDTTITDVRATGRRALGLTGDVRSQDDLDAAVAATVAELGRVDILVANAGIALMDATWEMSREDWDLQLATNLTGVWQSCKAVIPHMIEQQYGRIILVASTLALKGVKGFAGYSATKAGVAGFGRALAAELAEHRITVNSICPSTVPAGSGRGLAHRHGLDFESLLQDLVKLQAIPVLLEPIDISNAVLFLASDEARYLTGAVLPVDGGTTAI